MYPSRKSSFFPYSIALLTSAVLFASLFSGCGKPSEPRSIIMAAPPASERAAGSISSPQSTPESEPQPAAPVRDAAMNLSYAARSISAGYAGNENGCYSLIFHPDSSADLVYTDYNSLEMAVLGDSPMQNGAVRGHLAGVLSGTSPVWAGRHLFLFCQASPQGSGTSGGSAVIRLEADGSGAVSCTFDAAVAPAGAVLWDGAGLYFIAKRPQDNETSSILMRLDAQTMELSELHVLEPGYDYTIEGFWQKGPVICAAAALPPTNDPTFNSAWEIRGYSLFTLGMASGQRTELTSWQQGTPNIMLGSTFFYWSGGDDTLYSLKADTGESAVVGSGFAPDEYNTAQMLPVLDGMVRLQFSGNLGYDITDYIINPSTGDTFLWDARGLGDKTSVLAENALYFLVQSGDKFVRRELTDPAFTPDSSTAYNDQFVTVPEYSLISKSDYWAQDPVFTPIADMVYV